MSLRTTYSNFQWYKLQILVTFRKTSAFNLMCCSLLPIFSFLLVISTKVYIRYTSLWNLFSFYFLYINIKHICYGRPSCVLYKRVHLLKQQNNYSRLLCFLNNFVQRCDNPNPLEGQRSPGPLHASLNRWNATVFQSFVFTFVISEADPDPPLCRKRMRIQKW
jgi:hypothetical protein